METRVNFKINVKKKFTINGREYGSIEEMPEDIRKAYEKAVRGGVLSGSNAGVRSAKVVLNGQEYRSVDDMPAAIRQIYEGTMEALRQKEAEIEWGKDIVQERPLPRVEEAGILPTVDQIGIHPATNYKLWIAGLAIVFLLACLYLILK